mmetsp:Transcript_19165/g.38754  ORF Transcript_19165/g.38754 Transcript_19165/m.38754 type:complete len:164 (+) Transcript_19165:45-536(+)|eukprot:CAMPEP_0167781900 /NCGR_PEP_ID=MMETSP0111_2-20121227/6205_1 /TAXON_ID=91324 /ORGANISM="Lotharella globosa, Strain CCCM811" /LENGTH=163 /DNA_ID=CAMNT_0007672645 /DNA_START=40 /DNA_END=531 /DNA_ORIENTATION=-
MDTGENNELSIENFAFLIDSKDEASVKKIIDDGDLFKGFPPLAIAGMHTNGTWVLEKFGNKDNLSVESEANLKELATHLQLDVDNDILEDSNFTPLMLAVMFGPPKSVEIIINKVGKEGLLKKTRKSYDAKLFANCRNDDDIQRHFKTNGRHQCEPCQACSLM